MANWQTNRIRCSENIRNKELILSCLWDTNDLQDAEIICGESNAQRIKSN